MPELPRGTVTFLFTDIEGSTALWERDRHAMRAAVDRQLAILRSLIAAHHGVLYKTVGDGTQAAFASAEAALRAAVASQRAFLAEDWGELGPIRVRMALHVGTVEPQPDGDYGSPVLNRLGRLLSAAHGEQVLLSGPAADLVHDHLPVGVALRDLGTYRLKDLRRPERIFQLDTPGLPTAFPPPSNAQAIPPTDPTSGPGSNPPERVLPDRHGADSRQRVATVASAGLVALLVALVGIGFWRGGLFGGDGERATSVPVVATELAADPSPVTATLDAGSWSLPPVALDDPPGAQAFIGLGRFYYGDAGRDNAQTLPGTLVGYVLEDPWAPGSWDLWSRDGGSISRPGSDRGAVQWTTSAPGEYVTLHPGDGFVIPSGSPFNIRFVEGVVAQYVAAVVSPVDHSTPWPGVEQGEWWSTAAMALPSPSAVLTLHQVALDPGGSRRFTATDGPLFLAPFGPAMTFALANGPATIRRLPEDDEQIAVATFVTGPEEPATLGAETLLDDVAGIFLEAGAEASVRNNGTEVVTVVVLEIASDSTAAAVPETG